MPLIPFYCTVCNEEFAALYSFRDASVDGTPNGEPNLKMTHGCPTCGAESRRVEVAPVLPALLYGDTPGFYKPSPTKRSSWKKVSNKEGNSSAI